jgi:hypothetical protein
MADELNIITTDANSVNVTTEDNTITITNDGDATTVTLSAAETTTVQIATVGPKGDKGDVGNIDVSTLATTGSNTFRGTQVISGSGQTTILQVHAANSEPWAFGIYNDTYSTTTASLAGWADATGEANIGTEANKPLQIYTNRNYNNPTLIISSSGVTINNKLNVSGGITGSLLGTASFATTASYALNAGAGAGFPFSGSAVITGSLLVTGGITGSFSGSVAGYVPNEATTSFVTNSQTSSFVLNSQTGSMLSPYTLNSQTSSFVTNAQTSSFVTNSQTSSFVQNSQTSSFVTNSQTASFVLNSITSSMLQPYVLSTQTGSMTMQNLTVTGTASIQYLSVIYETASVIYSSGSNQLGDATNDTQTLIGTIIVSGSQSITGSLNVSGGITGSFSGSVFGYVPNTATASFILNSQTGSMLSPYVLNSQTSSFVRNTQTGSFATTGSNTFSGSQIVSGSVNATSFTGSLQGTASWANNAVSSSYPFAVTGSSLYTTGPIPAGPGVSTLNGIFIGSRSGFGATYANASICIGYESGYQAAPFSAINIGTQSGYQATLANYTVYLGDSAGKGATNAAFSNFIGQGAGIVALNAAYSNFIGTNAGVGATSASYSTLIGYLAGVGTSGNEIGSNNIIIGTNISLPNTTANAINLGGVIFARNTYAITTGNPLTTPANGKVGINVVSPTYNFQVSGSVGFTSLSNTVQTNVVSIDTSTGQLYYQTAGGGIAATVDDINVGASGSLTIKPEQLEESKFTTINIFNHINFT